MYTLITGATGSIGTKVAETLSPISRLLLTSRDQYRLEKMAGDDPTIQFLDGDITSYDTHNKIFEIVCQNSDTRERLSVVVCSGYGKSQNFHQEGLVLETTLATNLEGPAGLLQRIIPLMLKRGGGDIVLLSSIVGVRGLGYDAAYSASHHGIVGLARSLALEYGKHDINVYTICMGFVESSMTQRSIASLGRRRKISKRDARSLIERTNPQRRIIQPIEVAEMIKFLLTNGAARSLAGNPIMMTGGA